MVRRPFIAYLLPCVETLLMSKHSEESLTQMVIKVDFFFLKICFQRSDFGLSLVSVEHSNETTAPSGRVCSRDGDCGTG